MSLWLANDKKKGRKRKSPPSSVLRERGKHGDGLGEKDFLAGEKEARERRKLLLHLRLGRRKGVPKVARGESIFLSRKRRARWSKLLTGFSNARESGPEAVREEENLSGGGRRGGGGGGSVASGEKKSPVYYFFSQKEKLHLNHKKEGENGTASSSRPRGGEKGSFSHLLMGKGVERNSNMRGKGVVWRLVISLRAEKRSLVRRVKARKKEKGGFVWILFFCLSAGEKRRHIGTSSRGKKMRPSFSSWTRGRYGVPITWGRKGGGGRAQLPF